MQQLTIVSNKNEKTIFIAGQSNNKPNELILFMVSLGIPELGNWKAIFKSDRNLIECTLEIKNEKEFIRILEEMKKRSEVGYVMDADEDYED